MVAANNRVIMGTRDAHVIRVTLDHIEDLEDIGDLAGLRLLRRLCC